MSKSKNYFNEHIAKGIYTIVVMLVYFLLNGYNDVKHLHCIMLSLGSIPMESAGAYCVSKHGIEAYANVLRKEMKKWDVHVSIIQPAGFKTGDTIFMYNVIIWYGYPLSYQ